MCGIIGIYGPEPKPVVHDIISGLLSLQHRGQDAVGVTTFQNTFHSKKGLGLVQAVFEGVDLNHLPGSIGLGQVRYTTQGANEMVNVQPFTVNYPFGLSMIHNGNVVNTRHLRNYLCREHHRLLETSSDLELLLYTLASELEQRNLKNLCVDDIFASVTETQKRVIGAYSTITIIANKGMLVFNDPYGFRPLMMGVKKTREGVSYGFASESASFDGLEFDVIGDIGPGEAVFIDTAMNVHRRICHRERSAFCVFCYIYFAREDSILNGHLVADLRVEMGKLLAGQIRAAKLKPDIIIDVPTSAYFFAIGLSEALGIPYRRGLAKNNHIGRSFISPTKNKREAVVHNKLNPIKSYVARKKVAVIDDSIVRGTTSRRIVNLLRRAGAAEVYFISAAPPVISPCVYGIDMATHGELIAADSPAGSVKELIGADAVVYQSLADLRHLMARIGVGICDACFSNEYPSSGGQSFASVEEARSNA